MHCPLRQSTFKLQELKNNIVIVTSNVVNLTKNVITFANEDVMIFKSSIPSLKL